MCRSGSQLHFLHLGLIRSYISKIVTSSHSTPVFGIIRESSLGLFDHTHENAESYSPSGSPRGRSIIPFWRWNRPFTPECRSKLKAIVHLSNWGTLHISNHPAILPSILHSLGQSLIAWVPPLQPWVFYNHATRSSYPRVDTALCLFASTFSGKSQWAVDTNSKNAQFKTAILPLSLVSRILHSVVRVIGKSPHNRPVSFIQQGWCHTSSCKLTIQTSKYVSGLET